MSQDIFAHHAFLSTVAQEDVRFILEKDTSYGASWKMAGGRSAWHMLRRKMDRMITMMTRPVSPNGLEHALMNMSPVEVAMRPGKTYQLTQESWEWIRKALVAEDIFGKIASQPGDGSDGTVLAEVRDLRRYLLLVEAEMVARGVVEVPKDQGSYIGLKRTNPSVDEIVNAGIKRTGHSGDEWDTKTTIGQEA